jgi:6-phosphogluconolactonase
VTAERRVLVHPDAASLAASVAARFLTKVVDLLDERAAVDVCLTGGSTGIAVLAAIAHTPAREGVDWSRVRFWWGDERYVARDDADRNEKQAREALLDRIDIPDVNVHAMAATDGEFGDDLDAAAQGYADVLLANFGAPGPAFDVHLLGVGPEGHINSLFPDTPAVKETERWVVGVTDSPKPPPRRITLTLPAIGRSRQVWLVVSGDGKADAVARAIGGAQAVDVPAAGATGTEATVWLLDEDAASKL